MYCLGSLSHCTLKPIQQNFDVKNMPFRRFTWNVLKIVSFSFSSGILMCVWCCEWHCSPLPREWTVAAILTSWSHLPSFPLLSPVPLPLLPFPTPFPPPLRRCAWRHEHSNRIGSHHTWETLHRHGRRIRVSSVSPCGIQNNNISEFSKRFTGQSGTIDCWVFGSTSVIPAVSWGGGANVCICHQVLLPLWSWVTRIWWLIQNILDSYSTKNGKLVQFFIIHHWNSNDKLLAF